MTLKIVIPKKPVSINGMYGNNWKRGQRGRFMTAAAKDFQYSVRSHAIAALGLSRWPKPDAVKAVDLQIVTYNCRFDADGPVKLIADSLEGSVYANDNCIRSVTASKGKDATKKPRVEITVELLEAV